MISNVFMAVILSAMSTKLEIQSGKLTITRDMTTATVAKSMNPDIKTADNLTTTTTQTSETIKPSYRLVPRVNP
jgi:hypothetical protein